MSRILFIYDGKMNGQGCDLDTLHMLEALSRAGNEVEFICRGKVYLRGIRSRNIWYNPARLISNASSATYAGARRRFLSRTGAWALAGNPCDCVMAWGLAAKPAFEEARKRGIRTVLHAGNLHVNARHNAGKTARWPAMGHSRLLDEYTLSDLITVPSEFCRQSFLEHGVAPEKVVSLERGADLDAFSPPPEPPAPFRVLFCGRVCDRKGARQVYEAWQSAGLEEAELWFAGAVDGPLREWQRKVESPTVKFLGFRSDLPELMRQCRVQVLLSHNEGLAKTLIEGSVSGLVTIASPETGLPIEEGRTGFTVGHTDTSLAAKHLRDLYDNRDQLAAMQRYSAEWARNRFSWRNFGDNFLACLENPDLEGSAPDPAAAAPR